MARHTRRTLTAAAVLTLCAAPAPALESTLIFGQPDGGEFGKFGYCLRGAGDLDGDGIADIVAGAPFDDTIGQDAGRAFVWLSADGLTGQPDLILDDGAGGEFFGFAVAGIGDVDGDGFGDLAVGAPGFASGSDRGKVFVYRGGAAMDATADHSLTGEVGGDRFGWSIARAGDMDRDGTDDFVVGAPYNDAGGTDVGRAYLFTGQGSVATIGPSADVTWTGEAGGGPLDTGNFSAFAPDGQAIAGPGFGFSVAAAADFRGGGLAGVVVGAPGQNGAQGRAYLFFAGSGANQLPAATPAVTLTNTTANEEFGWSVAGAPNLDGDARADVLVGAPGTGGDRGSVHLYYGESSPPATIVGSDAERVQGVAGDRFGFSVAGAGNSVGSGDGWVVGAPGDDSDGLDAGRAYLYGGTSTTPVILAAQGGGTAPVAQDQWGFSLAGLHDDLDGDGLDEFLVGAPGGNAPDNSVRGLMALVSPGSRIVATPSMELRSALRDGLHAELDFAARHVASIDDATLSSGNHVVARLGAGIRLAGEGLVARVPIDELRTESVELAWTTDGVRSEASFRVPDLRFSTPALLPPSPNPFNPRTTLSVELPRAGHVRLRIVDVRGRTVRDLYSGELDAGITPIVFDGTDDAGRRLSSVSYLAVLEADGQRSTRRMTLVQ